MSSQENHRQTRAKEVLLSSLTAPTSVEDALAIASRGTGATRVDASRALYSLIEEKKLQLTDPSPPRTTLEYLGRSYSFWFWGTLVFLALTAASIYAFPQHPPFVYVRYVSGAAAVLYLPGYTLIEALYPKKEDLDPLERLALSIGLSLALVPLVGLLLNYTPWGIRLDPIVASLSALAVGLALVAAFRKESYIRLAAQAG
jgi:hypothetical protein